MTSTAEGPTLSNLLLVQLFNRAWSRGMRVTLSNLWSICERLPV